MEERGMRIRGRRSPKRLEVKPVVGSLPTDRHGPPESIAGQAKIPQEAGERESDAHTTKEVSIYENQGELRPGTANTLSLALSNLVLWYPTSKNPLRQRQKSAWPLPGGY